MRISTRPLPPLRTMERTRMNRPWLGMQASSVVRTFILLHFQSEIADEKERSAELHEEHVHSEDEDEEGDAADDIPTLGEEDDDEEVPWKSSASTMRSSQPSAGVHTGKSSLSPSLYAIRSSSDDGSPQTPPAIVKAIVSAVALALASRKPLRVMQAVALDRRLPSLAWICPWPPPTAYQRTPWTECLSLVARDDRKTMCRMPPLPAATHQEKMSLMRSKRSTQVTLLSLSAPFALH